MKSMITLQREWEGQTCAVMGSGPSMTYALSDSIHLLGIRTIAVNNQGIKCGEYPAMAPWADILFAADQKWWVNNADEALKFVGRKMTVAQAPMLNAIPEVIDDSVDCIGNSGPEGFDPRPNYIRTGGNSGYQSIHIAAHLGAKRILLFGFDMHNKNGEHWFGYHSWRPGHRGNYPLFMARFNELSKALRELKIEVINCTPGSDLKCFPIKSFEEVTDALQLLSENTQVCSADSQGALGKVGARNYGTKDASVARSQNEGAR